MKNKNPLNEYGMTPGAPTPVSAQRTGSMQQSASPNAGGAQKRPPVSQSPSKLKPASPSTATPVSPTAKRGTLDKEPALISLKAQDVPVNSVVKNKAGKVVGTVVEPIQKTPNTPLPPGKPGGPKSDAVVIKDPRGKYKVVKGRDALIVDDPRVQQESVIKAKLTLENIVTVNNRNYGNSMRLAHIDQLPLEEQLSLLDKIDNDKLNEAWGMLNEGLRNPKDNPCWKGYKPVGTKKKNGRTVPNCVPKENISEALDAPYPYRWGRSSNGNMLVIAKLPDRTSLEILFARSTLKNKENNVNVEFERGNSVEITGQGDAFRILATVLSAVMEYISKYKPDVITFSAEKMLVTTDRDYNDIILSYASRIKLYKRLAQSYGAKMGYDLIVSDDPDLLWVDFMLTKKPVADKELTEALDAPYPYTIENMPNDDYRALAELPDGTILEVIFNRLSNGDTIVDFTRDGDANMTGEGDSFRIFATVMAAIKEYIYYLEPNKIEFTASKVFVGNSDELIPSTGRAKLYKRLVQKYASQLGYTPLVYDGPDNAWVNFTLRKTYTTEQVDEALDSPYPYRWEPMGSREDYHVAYTELEDGTPLEITFERDAQDDAYEVEFYRNYSRKVSGMGDAQGVFATVLAVIKDFIQRVNPETITFGAVKEDPSAKITSRTKLYDRMVAKYASQLGYNVETDRTSKFAVYYTLNRTKSDASDGLTEAFDSPYPYVWDNEENDDGNWDATTRLPDGTPLHIMFSDDGDEVSLEFYRSNDQSVTGEGDAYRVFATVMAATSEYIKANNPEKITFTAAKEDSDEKGSESRAKLYNRMVTRYVAQMGYTAYIVDDDYGIHYTMVRKTPAVQESLTEASGYIPSKKEKNDPIISLIDKARDQFGEDMLHGGNCGMFALALATKLKEQGIPVTLGLLFNDANNLGEPSDIIENEADLYHVVVEYNGKYYDGTGIVTPDTLLDIAYTQYGDDAPGWFTEADPFDKKVEQVIRSETNWNKPAASFYEVLSEASGYILNVIKPSIPAGLTEGAVPNNDKVRTINKLLSRPFPASDIKGQMDAFFAIPDPSMIKAFRQARAEKGDNTSLHPVLRTFIKTLHPAIQKGIKLYEQPRKGPQ